MKREKVLGVPAPIAWPAAAITALALMFAALWPDKAARPLPLHLPDGTTITCTIRDGQVHDCTLAQPTDEGRAL